MEAAKKTLQICMLGGFSISCGALTVDDQSSRSKRVWTFLEYLIANREKQISQNDLIEAIWPDEEIGDPGNTLKTIAHRARNVLEELSFAPAKDMVLYQRGTYAWNNTLSCTVDAERFIDLCEKAENEKNDAEKLGLLVAAAELYKGDFLPKSSLDSWATPLTAFYRTHYIAIVHEACEMLYSAARFEDAVELCRRATVIDPYDEDIHLALIRALVATGAQQAAMQHYSYVTDLFFSHFGVTPSKELTTLYKEIVKTSKSMELDLGVIKEGLTERELINGAFFCEYEFFKDIYRLEARSVGRGGQSVHIALLTVLDGYGKKLTQKKLNTAMERFKDVIGASLRRGDVFTRYSLSQYLLMLPSASFENSDMVVNRITRNFKHTYPKMEILIQYSILPLDPIM